MAALALVCLTFALGFAGGYLAGCQAECRRWTRQVLAWRNKEFPSA